jgi:hypothetical protein
VRRNDSGKNNELKTAASQLNFYEQVVANMCRQCASPAEDEVAKCWDAMCPLRPISPLELSSKAKQNPPLGEKDWD